MKWGVGIIIANYLILYVFQLHIKYYRQMGSFYLVHTGKDRHQHWSSNDLQAVPLTTTHTTPNHILTLRSNPMSAQGLMRITTYHTQVIRICIASDLDSWGQKSGEIWSRESQSPLMTFLGGCLAAHVPEVLSKAWPSPPRLPLCVAFLSTRRTRSQWPTVTSWQSP